MLVKEKSRWNQAADVVVVGFGAAGAVAAITASDSGADVLILEKQPAGNHISTSAMSSGIFLCPNDVINAARYMEHISAVDETLCWTDRNIISVWAEYACQNRSWLESLGGSVALFRKGGEHNFPGSESIIAYWYKGMGKGLMRFLENQIKIRNIPVIYDSPADRLLTNTRGEVVGVRAVINGKLRTLRALRAVVMATGGFEFDETMKLNYLKVYPAYFAGSPANTGDGIRMVQEVGAALWHMNCTSGGFVIKLPEFPIALGPNFDGRRGFSTAAHHAAANSPCGYIVVDRLGRRYTNEDYKRHTAYYELGLYDSQKLEYPRIPSYWVFDRTRMEAGPLPRMYYGPVLHKLYTWSGDNLEEIARGHIVRGDNIETLSSALGMDPEVLKETVTDYNICCKRKVDPRFQRAPRGLTPLSTPPFFAIKLWPGSANTQGGPRRNHRAQVISVADTPIPRLYASGELGSIYGMLYPGSGGNLAECFAFGRVAGKNAAAEPRSTG